ncbi:hypothetical protein BKA65DRAFT_559977 [Rhexocercosporidium sp. MPI-PUGE-AT-0058]|nr:hypothetical protein BKA65DRAFT_559977 [Rhexocercosporidium sp. MPI-PUGE-AT-0058]
MACVGSCAISIVGIWDPVRDHVSWDALAGKTVNGLAIGCLFATATAWASEISPMHRREPIQSAIVLFVFFMQAIGLVVVRMFVPNITPKGFQTVFAIQWVWPILTSLLFIFMPEFPSWLLLKGESEKARRSLGRLNGPERDIDARLAHMALGVRLEEEQSLRHGTGSYIDLFCGNSLKRTLTVIWMFLGFGFTGACLLAQGIYFLIIAGLEPCLNWRLWGCHLCYLRIMAVTLVSTAWAITSEISSYRLRAKTQGVAVISNALSTWLFTFTVAYIYNVDAGNLGIRAGFIPVRKIREHQKKAKEAVSAMEAKIEHSKESV